MHSQEAPIIPLLTVFALVLDDASAAVEATPPSAQSVDLVSPMEDVPPPSAQRAPDLSSLQSKSMSLDLDKLQAEKAQDLATPTESVARGGGGGAKR